MTDPYRRRSALSQPLPARSAGGAKKSNDNESSKREIWSSLLDSVASSKKLPEKNLIVLGGTPELQKDFIDAISQDPSSSRKPPDRYAQRNAPVANQFALGYTYHDVFDADHEDLLARISLHLLSDPSPAFIQLLKPLLKPETIPATLVVILLDWAHAWQWLRQLRTWLRLLRLLLEGLDNECQDAMEELMTSCRNRGRGGGANVPDAGSIIKGDIPLPLGSGEWDDPLGLPLCVVCQNADKVESLEKDQNWRESDFDFVQQNLRTVLLKHGGSLVYTSASDPNFSQSLIHSLLGIQSLLKRQPLKHNIIDRDKILIPPNWDSWGKIRVLDKSFDTERVSKGWNIDLHGKSTSSKGSERNGNAAAGASSTTGNSDEIDQHLDSATALYEELVPNTRKDILTAARGGVAQDSNKGLEVETVDMQEFLAGQLEVLEKLRQEEERDLTDKKVVRYVDPTLPKFSRDFKEGGTVEEVGVNYADEGLVREHIGPVQFNVGGIQVDADDMLKRIASREADRRATTTAGGDNSSTQGPQTSSYLDTGTPARPNLGPSSSTMPTTSGPSMPTSTTTGTTGTTGTTSTRDPTIQGPSTPDHPSTSTANNAAAIGSGKSQNEALASFFAGLMKKADPGSGSNASSPSR